MGVEIPNPDGIDAESISEVLDAHGTGQVVVKPTDNSRPFKIHLKDRATLNTHYFESLDVVGVSDMGEHTLVHVK